MSTLAAIATYLLESLGGLYLLVVMLRFLFQVVRADFYNPVSKFIARATSPLVVPLRRIIPSVSRYDTASLVLAFAIQAAIIFLCYLLAGEVLGIWTLLLFTVTAMFALVITILFVSLVLMIVGSFVAPGSYHPLLMLARQLVWPLCSPFHRVVPPFAGIDISPFFVGVLLHIASMLVWKLATTIGIASDFLHLLRWI